MASSEPVEFVVADQDAGQRIDAYLAHRCPSHSRVQLRRAITAGGVLVDGRRTKPAHRLSAGQHICVTLPETRPAGPQAEPMDLEILYEDEFMAAVNKPPGLVVHPSKGHWVGTLANGLAYHFTKLSQIGGTSRPGIVHRLDRDTSGVIVVAKTDAAHLRLANQWASREIEKEYFAIVAGVPDRDRDRIEQPIGIHPYQREKMAIRANHSTTRQAETFYEVEQRFRGFAAVRVLPKTGRTHQIRVHLAHIGCPVLCDRLYGGRSRITLGEIRQTDDGSVLLDRQALHARRLRLKHPDTDRPLELTAPLPQDLQQTLAAIAEWRGDVRNDH